MTPLPIDQLFLMLAALLLAAGLFGAVCGRLGIPPVIGELTAGLVLGPSLLGWVAPAPTLQALAEIGVVLLLFEVGMDADLSRLARAGARSVAVALTGFFLPFALGFGVAYGLFGLSLNTSLLVGATLTATSIGITARVLEGLGLRQSEEGQVIIGAAVLSHQNLSEFVLRAVRTVADETLAAQTRFVLPEEQMNAFYAALDQPAKSIPRLRELLKKPSVFESQ